LGLKQVVLVGWSMGAFVLWDYIKQFGVENLKATVIVSESASDFKWPDWPNGIADFPGLCGMMHDVQTDRAAFVRSFIPLMFKNAPSETDTAWMFEEITRLPESIASSILFDQTVQDYRPILHQVTVPTLACFGRDEKLIPVAGGEHLVKNLPSARLLMFEESGHCPFLEEPDRFNGEVDQFIMSLNR
jgi:pimeloyl-ACP methyl ester carboxylesterase